MHTLKMNTKMPIDLTGKMISNAMRIFENKMTNPQFRSVKSTIRGIRKKSTAIMQHLHEGPGLPKKQAEKMSHHLGNVDLPEIVEEKALKSAMKRIENSEDRAIISYDESDAYKPDAKKMPGLSRIRDGSTGLTGNGYIFRGMNVEGVSILSKLDEDVNKKKKREKTVECLDGAREKLGEKAGVYAIDRGGDCTGIHTRFKDKEEDYVLRAKLSRVLLDVNAGTKKKITSFKDGKHRVELSSGEEVFLYVLKRKGFRTKLYIFSSLDEEVKKIVDYYLSRRSVEKDFAKMKELGLEDVRLLSMKKIKNILAIIQFIIVLAQEMYERVTEKIDMTSQNIYLHYKKFCKRKSLTENPTSFLKFVSHNLSEYISYKPSPPLGKTLFGGPRDLKKLGLT